MLFQAFLVTLCGYLVVLASPIAEVPRVALDRNVSQTVFAELEELSRLTAISYCVGSTGIQEPFQCLNRCSDFPNMELVTTFSTGIIEVKACGYIAVSHHPSAKRIILAFRGTQSFSDVIYDMMTWPAEYLPYPLDDARCNDCRVHSGFMSTWTATRSIIMPTLDALVAKHADYELVLTGHSLGGALAALASLEFRSRGWNPKVATFGEPRFGNEALATYFDTAFPWNVSETSMRYRRVTHIRDPVPLLPFEGWGWSMHGGEIFISKEGLPPAVEDLERCAGDADPRCIQGTNQSSVFDAVALIRREISLGQSKGLEGWMPSIPERWRIWESLSSHLEYFGRLGICFDPQWPDYPGNEPSKGTSPEL